MEYFRQWAYFVWRESIIPYLKCLFHITFVSNFQVGLYFLCEVADETNLELVPFDFSKFI